MAIERKVLSRKERVKKRKLEEEAGKKSKEKETVPVKSTKKGLKKFGKSIDKLGNRKAATEKLMSSVSVVGSNIFPIQGEIVSRDKHGVTMRYKKEKSRTISRETFTNDQIVAISTHGEKAVVYVRTTRALLAEKGSVVQLDNGWIQCTTVFGETLEVNPKNRTGFDVQVKSNEDEEYVGGGKQKSSKRVVEEADDSELDDDDES